MPNTTKIILKAPENAYDQIAMCEEELKNLLENVIYTKTIAPTFKSKFKRLFFSVKKNTAAERKKILNDALTNLYEIAYKIYISYYEDSDIRKRAERCLNSIKYYFKQLKIPMPKQEIGYKVYGGKIKILIRTIGSVLKKIKSNLLAASMPRLIEEKKKLTGNISQCHNYGVDVEREKAVLDEILNSINPTTSAYQSQQYQNRFKSLVKACGVSGRQDWMELYEDLDKLYKVVYAANKELEQPGGLNFADLLKRAQEANKNLTRKYKFAKTLSKCWVLDNNMRNNSLIGEKDVLKSLDDIKKLVGKNYGKYVLCACQNCLDIARTDRMAMQYNHKEGDYYLSVFKGPYYVIVDEKANQVTDKGIPKNGFNKTVNKSSTQTDAEKEVQNYLVQAFKAGSWEV